MKECGYSFMDTSFHGTVNDRPKVGPGSITYKGRHINFFNVTGKMKTGSIPAFSGKLGWWVWVRGCVYPDPSWQLSYVLFGKNRKRLTYSGSVMTPKGTGECLSSLGLSHNIVRTIPQEDFQRAQITAGLVSFTPKAGKGPRQKLSSSEK